MLRGNLPREGLLELAAVGDISFGDVAQCVGGGVHTRFERVSKVNRRYPFEHTAHLFEDADVVFGNLETVLSHRNLVRWRASSLEMRGHPDAVDRLVSAGFTILNVANNHMMQHGPASFLETVDSLRARGLGVVGVASPTRRECLPETIVRNGITTAFLGFAFEKDKYFHGPVEYAYGPECDIPDQVTEAKKHADVVICSLHWGVEFMRHPSAAEETLGRQLIDAGAALVLGHHPHVARRVERYGTGLIAYSLGNFVFDMLWNPWLRTGLVLRVLLSRNGVEDYGTELVWIGEDYQPRPLQGEELQTSSREFEALRDRPQWIDEAGQYDLQYENHVTRNRYESYRYFLRNMKSRPVTYTLQTLLGTLSRKISATVHRA